jgi:hypothetical protein
MRQSATNQSLNGKFPVKQGKYREFLPFSAFFGTKASKETMKLQGLSVQFPDEK